MSLTVQEVKLRLQKADEHEFAVLERALAADVRKGVRAALEVARRRLEANQVERLRIQALYEKERAVASEHNGTLVVGLDEVGRGSLAGPLAVGAVVLPVTPRIEGLNDSKEILPATRERLAVVVKRVALAWAVEYIPAADIDAYGMSASLIVAFRRAVSSIEITMKPDVILLDGNALHLDAREVNVIKGDKCCASIAAASIVAKVERDALMCRYAHLYPQYGFESCKGYASPAHIQAIKRYGLCPLHRVSFCTAFTQPSLF